MKVKLLNVLKVCAITLGVFYPAVVAFSIVWDKHVEFVTVEHLSDELASKNILYSAVMAESPDISQCQTSITIDDRPVMTSVLASLHQYKLFTIVKWFLLITPIGVGLAIIIYDRYLVYRAAVFKAQVAMLERVWQHNTE